MGLKHLQALAWAAGLVWVVGAVAQGGPNENEPNYYDSDGDGVFDSDPDLCPETKGVATNYGCPAGMEVVIVYGTRNSHPPSTALASLPAGTYNVAYHDPVTRTYSGVTEEASNDEDGDGVRDADDLCSGEAGNSRFNGCTARTYCLTMDGTYEQKCLNWAVATLSIL